jgi:hypothetical protein
MLTRDAVILVLVGMAIGALAMFGIARAVGPPSSTAKPHVYHGNTYTNGDASSTALFAPKIVNGFPLVGPEWRDRTGSWHDRGPVACLHFGTTRGVTAGVVHVQPTVDAPGMDVLAWVECPDG